MNLDKIEEYANLMADAERLKNDGATLAAEELADKASNVYRFLSFNERAQAGFRLQELLAAVEVSHAVPSRIAGYLSPVMWTPPRFVG